VRWRGVVRVCCPEIVRVPIEAARLTWQGAIRNGAATGKMKERPPTEAALRHVAWRGRASAVGYRHHDQGAQ
jgi:hypothetical protein